MLQDPPTTVETVVVRAARLPPAAGDPAFSVVSLAPETLRAHSRLDQALEQVPGLSLFRRTSSLAANPTTQGVSLRAIAGSGASRALVTLDGVPQNDPFGGWVIWAALPPETIEAVRVVRGAGAGPYGAGALTGTIELDALAHTPGGIAGEAGGGEFGYARVAAVADAAGGGADLLVAGSGETSGGWIPVRARRGAADTRLTLTDWSASARVQRELGPAVLAARVAAYEEDRGAGLAGATSRERGGQASLTLAAQPSSRALGWRLQGWVSGSNLANTSVSVAPDRSAATPANDQYSTPAVGWGLNGAVRRSTAGGSWEVGADVRGASGEEREYFGFNGGQFSRERRAGGETLTAGLYAEGSRVFGAWLITGGVRLDRWSNQAAHRTERLLATGALTLDTRPRDRHGVLPTARAGVRRDLGRGWFLRAAAYAGFRPATLNELHRPFRVGNDVTEANPALAPERLYGAEVGIGRQGAGYGWGATLFRNRLADAISNVTIGLGPGTFPTTGFIPAGGTLRMRRNAGSVDATGLELEAERRLAGGLSLRAAAAYTYARVDGGREAPQLTGLRPSQTPRLTATGGIAWRALERLTLALDLRYESARFEDDLNTRRLSPGAAVNARADWRLTRSLGLYLAAENLFDAGLQTGRTADNVVSYDAPRMLKVGLTLRR